MLLPPLKGGNLSFLLTSAVLESYKLVPWSGEIVYESHIGTWIQ